MKSDSLLRMVKEADLFSPVDFIELRENVLRCTKALRAGKASSRIDEFAAACEEAYWWDVFTPEVLEALEAMQELECALEEVSERGL